MSPDTLGAAKVLCYTAIDHRHRFTTGACKQIVHGKLMGPMSGLTICQHPEEDGFYARH